MKALIELFEAIAVRNPKSEATKRDTAMAYAHLESVGTFGHVI